MMGLRLGIDSGGTCTDAVLVNDDQRIVTFSKRLTTRHDLTPGIGDALEALPFESLGKTRLVALSTTLSTNSVVEGRGVPFPFMRILQSLEISLLLVGNAGSCLGSAFSKSGEYNGQLPAPSHPT